MDTNVLKDRTAHELNQPLEAHSVVADCVWHDATRVLREPLASEFIDQRVAIHQRVWMVEPKLYQFTVGLLHQNMYAMPEYEKLWAVYVDAAFEWRDMVQAPSLSTYATALRRRATVLKELARERAAAHKRKCLLCANIRDKSA